MKTCRQSQAIDTSSVSVPGPWRCRAPLLCAAALFGVATGAGASRHTFTELGAGQALSINNAGQVVGGTSTELGSQALVWNGGVPTVLGSLGGTANIAQGINNLGQAVGYASLTDDRGARGTVWNGSTPTALDPLAGDFSGAFAINDLGQVVGYTSIPASSSTPHVSRGMRWNGGSATMLGGLGGEYSAALDVNHAGQAVGFATTAGGSIQAVLWNGDTPVMLGVAGTSESYANAVNDAGVVVGWSLADRASSSQATLWRGGSVTHLGTLGGSGGNAYGINTAGQVVGTSRTEGNAASHAVMWNGTEAIDLNGFLDAGTLADWSLLDARAINDDGWIVGIAVARSTGEWHGYVLSLTAVPEPAAGIMMLLGLGGLGGVGFVARGRRGCDAVRA